MNVKALNQMRHRCGTCGTVFLSVVELRRHERDHALRAQTPEESEFYCGMCGALFLSANELCMHMQAHARLRRQRVQR